MRERDAHLPKPTGNREFDMNTLRLLALYARSKSTKRAAEQKLNELKREREAACDRR